MTENLKCLEYTVQHEVVPEIRELIHEVRQLKQVLAISAISSINKLDQDEVFNAKELLFNIMNEGESK